MFKLVEMETGLRWDDRLDVGSGKKMGWLGSHVRFRGFDFLFRFVFSIRTFRQRSGRARQKSPWISPSRGPVHLQREKNAFCHLPQEKSKRNFSYSKFWWIKKILDWTALSLVNGKWQYGLTRKNSPHILIKTRFFGAGKEVGKVRVSDRVTKVGHRRVLSLN